MYLCGEEQVAVHDLVGPQGVGPTQARLGTPRVRRLPEHHLAALVVIHRHRTEGYSQSTTQRTEGERGGMRETRMKRGNSILPL